MEEKKEVKKFIAFLDENNNKIQGYFKVLIDNGIFIKIETSLEKNILTIPYHRILKIKGKKEDEHT